MLIVLPTAVDPLTQMLLSEWRENRKRFEALVQNLNYLDSYGCWQATAGKAVVVDPTRCVVLLGNTREHKGFSLSWSWRRGPEPSTIDVGDRRVPIPTGWGPDRIRKAFEGVGVREWSGRDNELFWGMYRTDVQGGLVQFSDGWSVHT